MAQDQTVTNKKSEPLQCVVEGIEISMPIRDATTLVEYYGKSANILEFGSGGSTELALKLGARRIVSVESDKEWADALRDRLTASYDPDRFLIHHEYIGPTGKWGKPRNARAFRKFPRYALGIWEHLEGWEPDVILIDGRFRVGCLYGALLNIKKPTPILFDDYDRRRYRRAEKYIGKPKSFHRLAVFEAAPLQIEAKHLPDFVEAFIDPG